MALPAQNYMSNNSRTEGEMKVALEDQRDAIAATPGGAPSVELTIAAGVVTPTVTAGDFRIDTEADAAADDLTNILQTNSWETRRIRLRCENAARVTTLKHGAGGGGQILTVDGLDFSMNDTRRWIELEDVGSDWVERDRGEIPIDELTALTVSDDSADLLRIWDNSANAEKRIAALQVGRVLQIVHATDAGSSHSNTSYANLNGAGVSITPKSPNSKLLIEVSARMRCGNVASVNATATLSIYEGTAGTALSAEHLVEAFSAAGGLGAGVPGVIRVRVNSTGTIARTFGLQGKVNNASSLVTGSVMVWTITEYLE